MEILKNVHNHVFILNQNHLKADDDVFKML
jgi:hypothetical protein